MTREDEPLGGVDLEFTIDTSGDSRRVRTRRPRKKPSFLPLILLALATVASVVAFVWVLNRPPSARKPARSENAREIAARSASKTDRSTKVSARKRRPKVNSTRKKSSMPVAKGDKADSVVIDERHSKPNGGLLGSIIGIDPEMAANADTDDKGLGDAPDVSPPGPPTDDMGTDARPSVDEAVLRLYESGRLLVPKYYKNLRAIHARDFCEKHADDIALAFRKDRESMGQWLDKNIDLKEELYLALDPEHDNIVSALALFCDLKKQFPQRFPAYGELAIATAVVWDKGGRGVSDFVRHQRRTKSTLPENRVGAIENFRYLVDAEKIMDGRVRFLPWEFLVHAVNHRTAINERKWAIANYLHKRTGFGKCYKDVPYKGGDPPQLMGHHYTLENIRRYGGVCAMRADFANRVGKSLGVPTEYVSGKSRSGGRHAWVMWVELLGVSGGKIAFELKSHGRYRGDRYYVGGLSDSHTGRRITDRQLELRLHTVGLNPRNKRHASLVMKSFPTLREKAGMSVVDQIHFLHGVMQLCPGNEQAWLALAAMSRDGKIDRSHARKMAPLLDRLFITFANFPDFTWEVFDDLIACNDSQTQRNLLYERLVNLYVRAKRPDLACRAVLKYADYLAAAGKDRQAITALGTTIMAFPDEGRFVPKMLDAIEGLCPKVDGAEKQLIAFYQALLPKIPQRRGKKPQPYCINMYKRGISFFEKSGRPELANQWRVALAKLQAKSN